MMNANRRLQERKLPEPIVLCKLGGEKSSSVLNLSEDGLCFESLTPIEETGLLQVRLSVGLSGAIETTGRLAWIDSAKRTGGLRFLDLSAPARQQIRAWLSEASAASRGNGGASWQRRDKQADDRAASGKPAADKPVIWPEMGFPSMQLVPIERHRAQKRRQFFAGVLVGFAICVAVLIPILRYAGSMNLGSPPWMTTSANRAAQYSAERIQASAAQPVPPSASVLQPAAMQALSVAAPASSPQSQIQKQSPQTAAARFTGLMTGTSSPSAAPQPAKPRERVASSRPSTKPSAKESSLGATRAPLGASQESVVPAPADSKAHSSSGPAKTPVEGPVEGPVNGPVERQVQHPKRVQPTPQQLWAALQAGNMKAAVALADLYIRGEGVAQNCQQARVLLQIASEKNNAEASKKLQELDQGGCPANTATEEPKP